MVYIPNADCFRLFSFLFFVRHNHLFVFFRSSLPISLYLLLRKNCSVRMHPCSKHRSVLERGACALHQRMKRIKRLLEACTHGLGPRTHKFKFGYYDCGRRLNLAHDNSPYDVGHLDGVKWLWIRLSKAHRKTDSNP